MLDQNITTLLTSLIIVIGTLGGVFLTNRHTAKLETLRIEQEKGKRHTEAIEEIYQTLVTTDELMDAFAYDTIENIKSNLCCIDRIKGIKASSVRAKILLRLYLPSLKSELEKYEKSLEQYWNAVGSLHSGKKGEPIKRSELQEEFREARQAYKQNLAVVQTKLENFVK